MSNAVYWKVGTTYQDAFSYAVTGLADGDFTKTLFKDGVNVASPTVTIANPSADTRYTIEVDGSSGFVAATGTYYLVIYRTAIPNDKWSVLLEVTSNGQPSGTAGLANFTSSTGNGRITDGSSPILAATVNLKRSSGAQYAQLTTNASGNWGPVYFDQDDTYSVIAQASGYTVGTGTVTVASSGTSVTGPGADIALTAIAGSSGLAASTLWAYARRMFQSRTGTKADTEITQGVNDAIRMVAQSKDWPWLKTVGRVNLKGYYNTGTVTVTESSAVVTLSGAVFPSWAASGEIYIAGQWQTILTRDSDTQLTLDNAWASPDTDGSGLSYILMQYQYDLPSNCRTVLNVINQNNWLWGNEPVSRWMIDIAKMSYVSLAAYSGNFMHAVERDRMVVWPYPAQDLMANILYIKQPAALVSPTDEADWDPNQLALLERAIDYQMSLRGQCVAGTADECLRRYKEELERAFPNDRSARPRHTGWPGGFGGAVGIPSSGNSVTI